MEELTPKEKSLYGGNAEVLERSDEGAVYRQKSEAGEIIMTSYSVFPGIELVYNDVRLRGSIVEEEKPDSVFEINHCREGRIECSFKDDFCYLTPGDLSIAYKSNMGHGSYFPLGRYYGITILMDCDEAPQCLSCFLDDVEVSPKHLAKKFSGGYIFRSSKSIEHIFSELYSVPKNIRRGYFKIKILELLLFLSSLDLSSEETKKHIVSKDQAQLAKNVNMYLTSHMSERITLQSLSESFHVSGTGIKTAFKAVYGESVYAYIRAQKMQSAALLLKNTNKSVLEIAGALGYENGSKFAKAFRDVLGCSPGEYRKKYS